MSRKQWILVGLLGAQVLLLLFIRGSVAGNMAPTEPKVLFSSLASFTPATLEIQGAADEQVTLVREAEGWGLLEADGYPADASKVDRLLETLQGIEVRRPVVTSSRYHRALKVTDDDHERRVRIWKDAGEAPEIDFFLGTSPNYKRIHVRRAGDDQVYEAQGLGAYDVQAGAQSWFDASFVDVPVDQVTSLHIMNDSGSFEVIREEDGSWSSEGKPLDKNKVESLVRTVASIRAAEPVGRRDDAVHGLGSPQATATMRYRDPSQPADAALQELIVWVGGALADDENRLHIARSGFDFVAQVYKTTVDKLVTQKLSELAGDASAS